MLLGISLMVAAPAPLVFGQDFERHRACVIAVRDRLPGLSPDHMMMQVERRCAASRGAALAAYRGALLQRDPEVYSGLSAGDWERAFDAFIYGTLRAPEIIR